MKSFRPDPKFHKSLNQLYYLFCSKQNRDDKITTYSRCPPSLKTTAASAVVLLALAALFILPRNAGAQIATSLISSGSWNDPSIWNDGVPTASIDAYIDNNLAVSVTTGVSGTLNYLSIGATINGALNINGGSVTDAVAGLGFNAGSNGTATVAGGTWANSGGIEVGVSGTGTLNINGGNIITGYEGEIGGCAGSYGTVTMTSGTWWNSYELDVGWLGTGNLNVNGGIINDTLAFIGDEGGSNGIATLTGGTWVTPTLTVGNFGTATLNLSGSGLLTITYDTRALVLASGTGSTGTLNLGAGGTAGTLDAAIVVGGSGTATVNFNHTGNYTFIPALTGSLSVNKLGSGTTTLSGSDSYTGATTVAQGTLNVSGSISNTASVSVASGARMSVPSGGMVNNAAVISLSGTLSGAGSVGAVTATGGVIAPGVLGSHLTIDGLVSLDGSSSFQFTLGSTKASYDSVWSGTITLVSDAELLLADPDQVGSSFQNGDIVAFFQNTTGGNPQFTGTFESVTLPALSTGLSWSTTNLYSKGTVQVVPEPSTWAMLATGVGALLLYRRRR